MSLPPGFREAIHEPNNDRIGPGAEDDRDLCRRPPCCYGAVGGRCIDQVDLLLFEIPRSLLRHLSVALPISDCEYELFSLCKPLLFKSDPEPVNDLVPCLAWDEDADAICFCLLRLQLTAKRKEQALSRKPTECESLTLISSVPATSFLQHSVMTMNLSSDDSVRPPQHLLRNRQADLLRRLEIDHQLELRRLLHRQVGRLGALQDFVHVIWRRAGSCPLRSAL